MRDDRSSDETLMAAVRRGESSALVPLFERHCRRLYGFLRGLLGSSSAAEDLVQETFLRVLRHRRSYRLGKAFLPWVLRIARHAAWAHLKRLKRMPVVELVEGVPELAAAGSPEEHQLERERAARLTRALQELPVKDREVLLLSYFDGLRQREIAGIVGTSTGAVKVRVHRAKTALKRCLEDPEITT